MGLHAEHPPGTVLPRISFLFSPLSSRVRTCPFPDKDNAGRCASRYFSTPWSRQVQASEMTYQTKALAAKLTTGALFPGPTHTVEGGK